MTKPTHAYEISLHRDLCNYAVFAADNELNSIIKHHLTLSEYELYKGVKAKVIVVSWRRFFQGLYLAVIHGCKFKVDFSYEVDEWSLHKIFWVGKTYYYAIWSEGA